MTWSQQGGPPYILVFSFFHSFHKRPEALVHYLRSGSEVQPHGGVIHAADNKSVGVGLHSTKIS